MPSMLPSASGGKADDENGAKGKKWIKAERGRDFSRRAWKTNALASNP